MNPDWNIRACADHCAACEKKFADGERVFSRLYFTAAGYERQDLCSGCQTGGVRPDPPVSQWAASWRAPPPKAPEAVQRETAESLLRQFMETDEPQRRNVIFILAVMLERRRILVEREVQIHPDGRKIRVYEHRQTGECFVVPDPGLRLQELETVRQEVLELLGAPEAGAPAPAAAGAAREAQG